MHQRMLLNLALFIQQVQDSHLCLDQVDAWLIIVEVDKGPGNLLLHVLLLLQFEDVLQSFWSKIFI